MAYTKLIFIFSYFNYACAYFVFKKLPDVNVTGNVTSHLQLDHIRKICDNRQVICKSNNTMLCAVRRNNDSYEHRDFENSCYLLMFNMCEDPGKEYSIAKGVTCSEYLKTRRMYVYSGVEISTVAAPTTPNDENSTENGTSLRAGEGFSRLYDAEDAFDYHPCPLSCPHVYEPVCLNVNRGFGKHFKLLMFVNHCAGDLYYCEHPDDFTPPDDGEENVISSKLAWSFCGAHRYLQLARFSEAASAMGHYGWLQGDYSYSHIMEPHQRKPGFG